MSHGSNRHFSPLKRSTKTLKGLLRCLRDYLRSEGFEGLAVGKLVALGLGVGEDDGVRALAIVGDDVLQHARPMPGGHLDGQVRYSRGQLVHLPMHLCYLRGGGRNSVREYYVATRNPH